MQIIPALRKFVFWLEKTHLVKFLVYIKRIENNFKKLGNTSSKSCLQCICQTIKRTQNATVRSVVESHSFEAHFLSSQLVYEYMDVVKDKHD